jgi:CHAT domain-containing protein
MYPAGRCLALKGHHATEWRAKSQMNDRRIVHFATHGVLDDRNPMYSRLVLARGDDPADDGSLEAWEITRLTLDADLVVLSACDTARGEIGGGEGVVGMAWSFFVAGARSTLATQWRVESDSTARLMIQFHRSLLEARGPLKKAHALRKAQLQLLRHDKTRHPFYWAAFVLLGDAS